MASPSTQSHAFQAPRGTRDFYPLELARRRWIEDKWRRTAVRHGFDEIDGPTFEHLDLYTVKSGDGIVSELFSFTRQGGETRFALRPEFTPTLARMAASRANALPKPTKWFSVGPYFRAERPQRGRLREFLQWNVDVIGDDSPQADAECIACCVEMLKGVGLTSSDVQLQLSDRRAVVNILQMQGVTESKIQIALQLIDRRDKITDIELKALCHDHGFDQAIYNYIAKGSISLGKGFSQHELIHPGITIFEQGGLFEYLSPLSHRLKSLGVADWCRLNLHIVRGLAYYTGTVFEVHETTGAERAIAGGGRYDNLIELFGGPPTPAVGFAMGDVVLSLVLQDKGLMPTDEQIAADLGLRPDVYVIPTTETEHLMQPLVARLRREGMHARHTYKSTRNVGKLLKEAGSASARFALILESDTMCSIKDLDANEQTDSVPIEEAIARITPPPRLG